MIGAVLGVVLDHKDGRLPPRLAVAHALDQLAKRQVVAGDAGGRRKRAGPRAGGVVFAQAQHHQAGQLALLLELAVLGQKNVDVRRVSLLLPSHFGNRVAVAHVADEAGNGPFHAELTVRLTDAATVFAVVAIVESRACARVPKIARRGLREVGVVIVVDAFAVRVGEVPIAGHVVGVVGHRRPGMAVARDLPVAVEVVQQHILAGQLVMVGRHLFTKHHQAGVAIPFLDVAKHLVVGAVLLDDVNHVADRAGVADATGDDGFLFRRRAYQRLIRVGAVRVDLGRVFCQLRLVGNRHDRQGAGHRAADVAEGDAERAGLLLALLVGVERTARRVGMRL